MKPYREKLDINTLFKYRDAVLLHAHMMDATQKNRIEKFYSRMAHALGCKDYYQWFSNSFFTINDARALSRALKPLIPNVTIETVRDLKEIILKTAREKRKTPRIHGIVHLRYKHKKLNDEYSERACYYRRIFPLEMKHYWKTSEASKMDFKNVIELLLEKHHISTHERKN